jgi:thymidylate kinase
VTQLSHQAIIQLSSRDNSQIIPATTSLFDELNRQGIRYCHWKSNSRLHRGLEGRTDLDLLIDPNHEKSFKNILIDQGIKPILPPDGKQYPGMDHFLGFDTISGRLFHLHVHYQLVLGEQFVKNYALPLEKQFLDSASLRDGVMVPSSELELIVLSIRALLKYRDRDVMKDKLSIRSPGIPEHIHNEILWLLERTSLESIDLVLKSLPQLTDPESILEFLQTMSMSPRNGRKLLKLRRRVRKMLRPYQRRNRLVASISYFKLSTRKMFIQRSAPDRQMSIPDSGLMLALVGLDGAGKSTLCAELIKWLGWKVDVPFYYLGSKQPSIWSDWSYIFFRMARRGHREVSAILGETNIISKGIASARQILLAIHYLFIGRDRYKRYQLAQEEVGKGSIVIFDRFPLMAPFDGPQIHLIDDGSLNIISKFLSHEEMDLYRKFESLDLLFLLNVSLETSMQRKPDHPCETIHAKYFALEDIKNNFKKGSYKWDWVPINAELPLEDVFLEIKRSVWALI